jgi:glycosyltransferase involved in cell wall biosynthesis
MACGTPVIMTDKGSGPEVVEDGISGMLVNPLSPPDLANIILKLIKNDALRTQIGDQGYKRARQKFNVKTLVNQNLMLYQEMIGQHISR